LLIYLKSDFEMSTEIQISPQLLCAIKLVVMEAMKEVQSPWLSLEDMCKRFNKSKSTIYTMISRHQIPPAQAGRWYRQDLEDRGL
jgi:excisionase family DNA binding protein